jgi:hypothetical protein
MDHVVHVVGWKDTLNGDTAVFRGRIQLEVAAEAQGDNEERVGDKDLEPLDTIVEREVEEVVEGIGFVVGLAVLGIVAQGVQE